VAETNGLLNRRTGKSGTEGSNPSISATAPADFSRHQDFGRFAMLKGQERALARSVQLDQE
jgi:hypothetical protein